MKLLFKLCLMMACFFVLSGCQNQAIVIHFESNGGSVIDDMSSDDVDTKDLPIPQKEGFIFVGWFLDEALEMPLGKTTVFNQSLTLYAKYTPMTYTLIFDSNGGTQVDPVSRTSVQSSISQPADPTKEGFIFSGWYRDSALTIPYAFDVPINQDATLYAKWDIVVMQFTITFDTDGGTEIAPITGSAGDPIAILEPTKAGYIFSGWYQGKDSVECVNLDEMPEQSMTLYADWASEGLIFDLIQSDTAYEVSRNPLFEIVDLSIPKQYQGKPVTAIKEFGFESTESLVTVRLPITITTIGSRAFMNATSLKDVYLSTHVETLGNAIFRHTFALEAFHMIGEGTHYSVIDGVLFSHDLETLWRYPQAKIGTIYHVPYHVKTIEEDAFSGSQYLTAIDLGTGVTSIKDHAFYGMVSLKTIIIPDQVTTMGIYVFRDCIALEDITLGSGLTEINAYLFDGCVSLTSIVIPYSITFIGYGAFYSCMSLASIYIVRTSMNGMITGALFMFMYTSSQLQIYFPDTTTRDAYKVAYYWSSYASKMTVGTPS
jgi:uncharacterized repeat protein (TIGR02543 family)